MSGFDEHYASPLRSSCSFTWAPNLTPNLLTLTLRLTAGAGRAGAAGRLLPEPRRLVQPECARRRPRHLRLPLVRLHQQGGRSPSHANPSTMIFTSPHPGVISCIAGVHHAAKGQPLVTAKHQLEMPTSCIKHRVDRSRTTARRELSQYYRHALPDPDTLPSPSLSAGSRLHTPLRS